MAWEHLLLVSTRQAHDAQGSRWDHPDSVSVANVLDQLGAQGWELVAVKDAPQQGLWIFFKRPLGQAYPEIEDKELIGFKRVTPGN